MRQIAYPAALGSAAMLARHEPLHAAEWSATSIFSTSVDYDSDRRLIIDGKGSDAAFVTADLSLKGTIENLQISFTPHYTWRRYSDSSLGNGDDRQANLALTWGLERSSLTTTVSYWDQTTLISELLETGLVSADTHRRQADGGLNYVFNHTERRAAIAQVSYQDVSYYGLGASVLSGYKYSSGSLGERYSFNERGSFTVSTYADKLQSSTAGNSSHEYGLQAEVAYAFSEVTTADVALGKSRRELSGQDSTGTTASISLNRSLFDGLGHASAAYTRSLVPYGFGFLVEQQRYDFTLTRPLNAYVNTTIEFLRIQNNEATVLLRLDRPNYNNLALSFDWHFRETWSLGWRVEGIRTQEIGVLDRNLTSWRTSATLRWTPEPALRQW